MAAQVAAAKAVCRGCPVRQRCLAEALERIPYGIAGGLTAESAERGPAPRRCARPGPRWRCCSGAGSSHAEVARECGVSVRTVERWVVPTDASRGRGVGPGWFPVSALEVSRREQAGWATREHVRRVAVSVFDATERTSRSRGSTGCRARCSTTRWPGCGPGGWSPTSPPARCGTGRCGPGVRGAAGTTSVRRSSSREFDGACRERRRRGSGWSSTDRRPLPQLDRPSSAVWTCTTCRARVRDTGPFASHPDDRETGHLDDCARRLRRSRPGGTREGRHAMPSRRRTTHDRRHRLARVPRRCRCCSGSSWSAPTSP